MDCQLPAGPAGAPNVTLYAVNTVVTRAKAGLGIKSMPGLTFLE